jgi:hypothetical protein
MTVYTLKKLLTDCSKKKWRIKRVAKGLPDDKMKVLEECWSALNLWILNSMEKGKGANIPNFGRFEWDLITDFGGEVVKRRPSFVLADSFCRAYGAKNWKSKVPEATSTPLEMNFTEIAIRWSAILTKDTAFCGLRDIFQRLGQVLSSGRQCKIRFSCGRFVSKERKVAFVFDQDLEIKKSESSLSKARIQKTESMKNFAVSHDSEILELLGALSETKSQRPQSAAPSSVRSDYGDTDAFVPLPPMSPSLSTTGNERSPLESMVPKLNLGIKNGKGAPEDEEAGTVELGTSPAVITAGSSKPPMMPVSQRSKSGGKTPNGVKLEQLSRASMLSARRGLKLIEEEQSVRGPETAGGSGLAETGLIFAVSSKYRDGVFGKEDGRGDRAAQKKVMDEAYKRHMALTEADITGEEEDVQKWRDELWERELEYREQMRQKRQELADLSKFLANQISYNEKVRAAEAGNNKPVKAYPDLHRFQKLAKKYGVGKLRPFSDDTQSQMGSARSMRSTDSVDSKYMMRLKEQQLGQILRIQIEDKMAAMSRERYIELEDGRRFINHVNAAAREQNRKISLERSMVRKDLKESWDRDTRVKQMLANRRKSMKAGGISFGKNGEVVQSIKHKEASNSFFNGGVPSSRRSKTSSRNSAPADSVAVADVPSQAPIVPKDHSVGFDMRSAR